MLLADTLGGILHHYHYHYYYIFISVTRVGLTVINKCTNEFNGGETADWNVKAQSKK